MKAHISILHLFCAAALFAQTTVDFYVTASSDDGHVYGWASSWPPVYSSYDTVGTTIDSRNDWTTEVFDFNLSLMRFNTSSLPDNATVTAATLKLYVTSTMNESNRNFQCEYYSAWPIDAGDYTTSPGNNAHAGTNITALAPSAYNSLALINLPNISLTGYTGFRCSVSGGQPDGLNRAYVRSYDAGANVPWLQVTYTVPPPTAPRVIVIQEQS